MDFRPTVLRAVDFLLSRYAGPEAGDVLHLRQRGLSNHQIYPLDPHRVKRFLQHAGQADYGARDLQITRETPIATLGSCFVRLFKERLIARGFRHVQTEHDAFSVHSSCGWERVYTSANLYQILTDIESQQLSPQRFALDQGRVRDLFRHKVTFASVSEAQTLTQQHLAAARVALQSAEVLFLTLGQNEVWRHHREEFWLGQAPSAELATQGGMAPVQLSVQENENYLEKIYQQLQRIHPGLRLMLNIAPIPSTATFFDENVVVRSQWNKAILKVACGGFINRRLPYVSYFPAWELAQTYCVSPFGPDNRHPHRLIMEDILDLFTGLYVREGTA